MAGVDEADDRRAAPWAACPGGGSSGEHRAGADQQDPASGPVVDRWRARPSRNMSGGLFMNRHRSLGLYLEDEATAEPSRGSAPTVFDPGTSPSLAALARFGFPSSSSIDRTDVKFELFRK